MTGRNEGLFESKLLDLVEEWSRSKRGTTATAAWARIMSHIGSAARQPTFAWPNGCNNSAPAALRYLARNPRPVGGEDRYNGMHLLQLADEIESAVKASRYTTPVASDPVLLAQIATLQRDLAATNHRHTIALAARSPSDDAILSILIKHCWSMKTVLRDGKVYAIKGEFRASCRTADSYADSLRYLVQQLGKSGEAYYPTPSSEQERRS